MRHAAIAVIGALVLATLSIVAPGAGVPPFGGHSARAASSTNDVIANLFEWNWDSVAAECSNVLGPDGYGAVQVAPPEDSISLPASGHPWWEVYQPVAYDLTSRMGSRARFTAMVAACHQAGVKVYADAVINHMAGENNTVNTSYGGASFDPASFTYGSAGYGISNFHHPGNDCPTADNQISDFNNQAQVQECELVHLSDLYTQQDGVRDKIATYLNDLIGLGVDGFRVDAAKHMNQADMAAIEGRLSSTTLGGAPFIFQEVVPGSSNANLQPAAFEGNGSVLEFTYADDLKSQFQGSIANLRTFGSSWGLEPSGKSVVFVANHDTERNGSTLSYKDGATYSLATEFSLAWPYGTPQVYASFNWSGTDQGPPSDSNGVVSATDCGNGWTCTDRATGVAGMVGWHNAVAGTSVANWWDDGSNLIAFSRGTAGWIALNNEGGAATRTFATGLPAGSYCDLIHGTWSSSSSTCSGPTVTVDAAGNATVTVAAKDAVAIDVNAMGPGSSHS